MTTTVEGTAKQAHTSDSVQTLARVGIAARGVVWLVVGLLALSVVFGGDRQTDQGGALRAIADKPLGEVLLGVLVLGFLGYAAWRLLSAAVGHKEEDGHTRSAHRVASLVDGMVYIFLAVSVVRFLSRGDSNDATASRTAELMAKPGGRTAVGLLGVVLIAIGIVLAVKALRREHIDKLRRPRMPSWLRGPAVTIGVVGLAGRSFVLALIGVFLAQAAYRFNPAEAKGLDAALQTLAQQSFGKLMLLAAVIGMLAYALWSFIEAAYRRF
jgi:heme/copper-type cytochrome/quinol oxidase subunit 2